MKGTLLYGYMVAFAAWSFSVLPARAANEIFVGSRMDETMWPTAFVCPYCTGDSLALPDGYWSRNWTASAITTISIKGVNGDVVGTAVVEVNGKNANGKVPVKVYMLQFLDQPYCIAVDNLYPIKEDGNVTVRKGYVNLTITPSGEVFGTVDGYLVGDNGDDDDTFRHGLHVFKVEIGAYALNAAYRMIYDALPEHVGVMTRETKWDCGSNATLKYKKNKATGEYELVGLDDETKPNTSRLSLKFNARKGTFKGSFKAYATNEDNVAPGKKPTLKKYTFTVAGSISGSRGTGTATCKALNASWPVTIE